MLEINASHMPLGDVTGLRRPDGVGQAPKSGEDGGFMAVLESALGSTDSAVKHSEQLAEQFAAGEDVPVHELMTSIARSDLSLRLTTVATTRAIAAYQEIARLQV
ncbi:MAG: flagellar hook-basal body complex protein FliE [Myxococcota bacterium]